MPFGPYVPRPTSGSTQQPLQLLPNSQPVHNPQPVQTPQLVQQTDVASNPRRLETNPNAPTDTRPNAPPTIDAIPIQTQLPTSIQPVYGAPQVPIAQPPTIATRTWGGLPISIAAATAQGVLPTAAPTHAGNAEQGDLMQGGSQAPVPVTTPSANEPLSTMQRALEPQGLPGYVPGQRAFYSDGFKEMVVREAMLCPEGARIKPTCARFPGVAPVQVRTCTNHKPSAPAAPEPRALPFPCALSLLNLFPSLLPMCCAASQVDAQDLRTWHGASRRRGNRGSFVAGPGRPSR